MGLCDAAGRSYWKDAHMAHHFTPGDTVRVRPGDTIPADGVIARGASTVNQASITGESIPAEKAPGDEVFGSTINLTGLIDVAVTKAGADTLLGRVKDLILQGPGLGKEALDTFKVVCAPERITLTARAARCSGVLHDAPTRKAVQALADYWKLDAAFVDPDTLHAGQWPQARQVPLACDLDHAAPHVHGPSDLHETAGGRLREVHAPEDVAVYPGRTDEAGQFYLGAARGGPHPRRVHGQHAELAQDALHAALARSHGAADGQAGGFREGGHRFTPTRSAHASHDPR
jgi:hypothetical protein